jgi:glycosyltransferase involved in cell wall biosynthesis
MEHAASKEPGRPRPGTLPGGEGTPAPCSRVSICIPAYRAERFLGETLQSIRAQTFSDWELIVVEDGSRDATERLVQEFAAGGSQPVRFLRHEENRGLTVTRNTGITAARAEWIAILDSDDLWTPDHVAACMDRASTGDVDLVHGGSILFESDTGVEVERRAPTAADLAEFPRSLFESRYAIQPSSVLLAKSLWARVGGFNPDFQHVEDREMWLRCARAGGRFAYTGRQTCRYRKHGEAMSAQSVAMAEACARVLEQHLDWEAIPRKLRRRLAAEAWAAAGRLRWRSEPRTGREHFCRACAIEWHPRWWLHGALCAVKAAGSGLR